MTMLRADSFDFYNTAQIPRFWTVTGSSPSIVAGQGRNGSSALGFTNFFQAADWPLPSNLQEGFEHLALYWSANDQSFLTLLDNATAQLSFVKRTDQKIAVYRGANGATLLGVTSLALPTSGMPHVQIHWKIDNATGLVRILFNGTEVLNLTGQDTQVSANAYATLHRFGTSNFINSAMTGYVDDFVFNDGAGSKNNGLIGDKRVQWCPALAEGAQNDYTPSTGTNNAALLDENPANDDTDYIESSTPGHIDYVTVSVSPAIPTGASVDAVVAVTTDKKTDGGTRTARHKIRFGSGPTVSNGASYGPSTGYEIHKTIFEDTITVAEVNAPMQVGVEVLT